MTTNEKLRIGVIGAGGIANSVHLPSLRDCEDAEVVALCDIHADKLERTAREFGIAKTYSHYHEMLASEELDAVLSLVWPDALFRVTLECLRAGRHVLMEKPPGVTTFPAETQLRTAREEAGLTQADVAVGLGKPQSYVSKCESGERRVDVVELEEFANLYGKSFEYFLPT